MIEGRTIETVRQMTDEEQDRLFSHKPRGTAPVAIELDDGTVLYPSRDPEMNGPGHMVAESGGQLYGFTPDE